MRRTTSAAFTSALSVRNGVDAWPGVPLTRSVAHQRALLAHDDRELVARGRRDREAARFGDDVVALHRVALVLDEMTGAVGAQGLLVGDGQVHQVAGRAEAGRRQVLERHRHRRGEVQHVDRAAAPHLAVDELAAERVAPPAVGVDRHDVGVTHEHQRGRGGIGALDARHQAGPPGHGLVALDVEPGVTEVRLQRVDAAGLAARRRGAVVDAGVADELLEQVGDLGGGVAHPGSVDRRTVRPSR